MNCPTCNVLDGGHEATNNAAIWLREHLNIPSQCTIFEQFEEYFNCRIDVDDRKDYFMQPNTITFNNPADLTAFLLKWS
jgi:hypothetical protein